ncbi:hypothetical protein ABT061_15965 [Streptosporangium sp. NPDC002544]|uniref:hypothetical protein n=1 Tax=Streptosporangium sp. NPDC002544 TaxID=3154538 RepID=UPI00332615B4
MSSETAWPAGVIARYLTVGGATADVIDDVIDNRPAYLSKSHAVRGACTGERCGESHYPVRFTFSLDDDPEQDEDFQQAVAEVQQWARDHAERCRAMPKPNQT